jgi:hypothetical protein
MIEHDLGIKLADRIWIAVASLHQQMPERLDFTKNEIREKLRELGLMEGLKTQSVAAHLKQHLVANVPPSSTKYRMLYESRPGYLRLFRPDDNIDPARQSRRPTKQIPEQDELPAEYHGFLDWYQEWCHGANRRKPPNFDDDLLIRLIGSGRHIWADEHADEYVENLRREVD